MVGHTGSWYAASLPRELDRLRAPLGGGIACDVCIIGAGFTGISAAYHLASAGQRVVVLEANRVGWGASGRNGGQLHPGFRKDLKWFADTVGLSYAHKVKAAGDAALAHLDGLIEAHALPCDRTHGLITACRRQSEVDEERAYDAFAQETFGTQPLQFLGKVEARAALGTGGHEGAVRDADGGHIHPLAFVTALADVAEQRGAQIFDRTPVDSLDVNDLRVEVRTAHGTVRAQQVVLAGNGYLRGLSKKVEAHILPITNFIVATEPIGAGQAGGILPDGDAAADTRFVVRYWRPTPDGRLLFGGGEKFSNAFPTDIEGFVRPYLAQMYPDLDAVAIDYAWGGTLAITPNRLPLIRRLGPRVCVAAGFSGQGVIQAPFAGKIIADALNNEPSLLDVVSGFNVPTFPGGTALRGPLLFLAMSYFALKDRLG